MADIKQILLQPIPDFTHAREAKKGYRQHPLLTVGERNREPLVAIEEYGIAGQSYYSRPNKVTKTGLKEVSPQVRVREGIAERLARINHALQESDEVAELLGGKVELYVDEGYRSAELQAELYDTLLPRLIRQQNPSWSREQVIVQRDRLIAEPPQDDDTPSPHITGAAVDLKLRYATADPGYVPDRLVEMGHVSDTASSAALPDCFEHRRLRTAADKQAQANRRVFYWIMRGALLGDDSGFVVNPGEWWHWSYGDQMWAQLTNAPEAFYSFAEAPV